MENSFRSSAPCLGGSTNFTPHFRRHTTYGKRQYEFEARFNCLPSRTGEVTRAISTRFNDKTKHKVIAHADFVRLRGFLSCERWVFAVKATWRILKIFSNARYRGMKIFCYELIKSHLTSTASVYFTRVATLFHAPSRSVAKRKSRISHGIYSTPWRSFTVFSFAINKKYEQATSKNNQREWREESVVDIQIWSFSVCKAQCS